jgi:hypothetical protein
MIAVNIAIEFSENLNSNFTNLNEKIANNNITFGKSRVPHITLLQFYCTNSDIYQINNLINNIDLSNINKLELQLNTFVLNDYYIYELKSNSLELKTLQQDIKYMFQKYIKYPSENERNFCETIIFKELFDLVSNQIINEYNPHVTLGISRCNSIIDCYPITIQQNEMNVNLFKIGDFGTTCPINDIFYYSHRINTINELSNVSKEYGIELDLRDDREDGLILAHDPFTEGEQFDNFLKYYDKSSIILNIKSERIEHRVLDSLKKYNIKNYFFLDCSFPMIYNLHKLSENNIAIRFSEFESIETVLLIKNMVRWVWIDCFQKFPLTIETYNKIKESGLKICLVSPELQGHNIELINEFKNIIKKNRFLIDAICTKYYNIHLWSL